ncbi:MAG: ribonuclease P protein component [Dehalococcoidia bacterium]|nr:ribonuclease P protein component [Dehalococcoidia bacterium]
MRREQRLRKSSDFATAYREGRSFSSRLLVIRPRANGLPHNRYGFVTSRAVGKAVVRNKVRRRLREVVRSFPMKDGWDVVVIARRSAADATYRELRESLASLLARADVMAKLEADEAPEEVGGE